MTNRNPKVQLSKPGLQKWNECRYLTERIGNRMYEKLQERKNELSKEIKLNVSGEIKYEKMSLVQ